MIAGSAQEGFSSCCFLANRLSSLPREPVSFGVTGEAFSASARLGCLIICDYSPCWSPDGRFRLKLFIGSGFIGGDDSNADETPGPYQAPVHGEGCAR